MGIATTGSYVLVVFTEGYGKLTQIDRYPNQHRAGSGVRTIKLVDKTGELADARIVSPSQQVMFISANGSSPAPRSKKSVSWTEARRVCD